MDGLAVLRPAGDEIPVAGPDWKQAPVIRDPGLLSDLHSEWDECALCWKSVGRLSLHHILKHPKDDVRGNLVMLCGHGTAGCHGEIEHHNAERKLELGLYIVEFRADVIEHLDWRLGSLEAVEEWLQRMLGVPSARMTSMSSGQREAPSGPLSL